ncbi:MAG: hypothetical protein JXR88_05370 [Clostridia bacterium]|nr:hypothetical protein [Clostridia bacterium]
MNLRLISTLKWIRLIISVFMAITLPIYYWIDPSITLPAQEQILIILFGLFVFFLGLQYHFEKKSKMLSYFFMLFGVMMMIVSLITLSVL